MNKFSAAIAAVLVSFVTLGVTLSASAQEVKGDARAGQSKAAMCIGCHGIVGYQASFPEIYKAPMISGQSAKYISNALLAYQKDERKHPTMKAIAASLSEQDMADLGAYYSQHGVVAGATLPEKAAKEPSAAVAALLNKGPACVSCHGANFAAPTAEGTPKIAGQHADYLFIALKAYKTKGNPKVGRSNGVMGGENGVANNFSNAELKAMASYISSLPGDLKTVPQSKFK
jgi:cytochrome c553